MVNINVGMILVYVFSTSHQFWYLSFLAAFFHILVMIFMIALALVDPPNKPFEYGSEDNFEARI